VATVRLLEATPTDKSLGITFQVLRFSKMKLAFVLLLLFSAGGMYAYYPRVSQPAEVVSAVAPVYPAIAMAAHGSGDVVVVADINKSGDVTSTRVLSGHNLLRQVSVEAARRWKFSTSIEDHRQAELTFTFRIVPDKTAGIDRTPVFYPPYHVEVRNEIAVTTTNH
jgi:TonB family protein